MNIKVLAILSIICTFASPANAWNTGAHIVNWVQYEKSGRIVFVLYASGESGEAFQCRADGNTKLIIESCNSADNQCMAAVNRMASTLLAARLAGKTVHVENQNCTVTEVALAD